jgi:hypothetical protein
MVDLRLRPMANYAAMEGGLLFRHYSIRLPERQK